MDLSIFDPGTNIAAEFYVSLHELMNSLASRTTLIWSAVDVLQNACRNAAARQALIHTFKFAPILARLLEVCIFVYFKDYKNISLEYDLKNIEIHLFLLYLRFIFCFL